MLWHYQNHVKQNLQTERIQDYEDQLQCNSDDGEQYPEQNR